MEDHESQQKSDPFIIRLSSTADAANEEKEPLKTNTTV